MTDQTPGAAHPFSTEGADWRPRVPGALSAIGSWFGETYQEFRDDLGYDPDDALFRALTVTLSAGSAIAVGAMYVGIMVKGYQGPGPEHFQTNLITTVQDSHGAYARGVADGLVMAGVHIPAETLRLIEEVAPDLNDRDLNDRMATHLQGMRQAGMAASMTGEFDPEELRAYAEFVQRMPQSVHRLAEGLTEELGPLTGGEYARDIANIVVTLGLISDREELSGPDLHLVISRIGSKIEGGQPGEVGRILERGLERAALLKGSEISGTPDPDTIGRDIAPLLTRNLDKFLGRHRDLVTDGPGA